MKARVILIIILALSTCIVAGYEITLRDVDSGGFSLGLATSGVSIMSEDVYSHVELEGCGYVSHPGDPELPLVSEYIILAQGASPITNITGIVTDTIFALPPQPVDVPYFESGEPDGVFPGESDIYQSWDIWPPEIAGVRYAGIARGVPLGLITVCPVQYHFGIGAYLIHRKIRIDIDLRGEIARMPDNLRSRPFFEMLSTIAINGNAMPGPIPNDPGTYLILTPENCETVIDDFAEHKRSRGHRVVLKNISDFGVHPDKDDIKDYIQSLYDTLNPAPTFLLIVGDVSMSDGTEIPDYGYDVYTSDHPYSLLDGDDYFSDIFPGRWAIDNINECRTIKAKTEWFDSSPTSGGSDWLGRACVVSTYDHAVTPVWNVLWVWEFLYREGFSQVDTFFERGSIIPTPAEISAPINNGLAFIDYRGWAGSDAWWEPWFERSDITALTNSEAYPVVTSIVCGNGDFGSTWTDPCFGETWIRAGSVTNPHGAVAFFSTTDYDTHTRYNNAINGGFYLGLFEYDLPCLGQDVWLSEAECLRQHPWETEHIEQYFHSYELIGDPGLMMYRGVPDVLTVTHDSVSNGANIDIQVSESGNPVAGARVCLYRIETGEQSVGFTDYTGKADIFVPGGGDGTVVLTVVSPFYEPSVDTFSVDGRPMFELIAFGVEDTISGDGDGVLEPLEEAVLRVTIENTHHMAISPVEAYLWSEHPDVFVTSEFDSITIPGHTEEDLVFEIAASGNATGGGPATMKLYCDSRNGTSVLPFEIPLLPGELSVDSIRFDDSSGGDGDEILEPGETAEAFLLISNGGEGTFEAFTISVYSQSGWVSISDEDSISVSSILPHSSVWSDAFIVGADSSAFTGYPVEFVVYRRYSLRSEEFGSVGFALGEPETRNPTGPDSWGYFAYDDTDVSLGYAPTTGFEDISGTGIFVPIDDDIKFEIELPFDFVFYGESFDTITICSNGWLAPGVQPYFMVTFYNNPIPGPNGPWGTIAPFWDDLEPISGSGGIYYQYFAGEGKFVVQWEEMQHARIPGVTNTFQAIIFDPDVHPTRTGDSPIEFRYGGTIEDLDEDEEYSTVGIESPNHTIGVEYLFSQRYASGAAELTDGRAIRFTTDCGAGMLTGAVILTDGADPIKAVLTTADGQMAKPFSSGEYRFSELPPGDYNITCAATGYFTSTASLTLDADETDTADFALEPIPVAGSITASKADVSGNITIEWSTAPASVELFTGYRLYKYLAPGGIPEIIESVDTYYVDVDVESGRKYWYRVQYDYSGNLSNLSEPDEGWVELNTQIEETEKPVEFSLNIVPNPFNTTLSITIKTPDAGNAEIFDLTGRLVYHVSIGSGRSDIFWDGHDAGGIKLPSGLYFVRINCGERRLNKKAVMLK